jgi:hypothetical protein
MDNDRNAGLLASTKLDWPNKTIFVDVKATSDRNTGEPIRIIKLVSYDKTLRCRKTLVLEDYYVEHVLEAIKNTIAEACKSA